MPFLHGYAVNKKIYRKLAGNQGIAREWRLPCVSKWMINSRQPVNSAVRRDGFYQCHDARRP
ncbi:MAG: hypothetical protein ABJJ13_01295 [Rhodopirellula bahusiensis]|uniref:hypothetical protein n=1 Tax=Rhodopirellula bahusiensis TaxID=2014065 RepID=UPI003297FA72